MTFRILLVDDSRLTRRIVSDVLTGIDGVSIAGEAGNGKECLEFLRTHAVPDLIIMDVEMPELDGIATLKMMQQEGLKVPVLMLSVLTQAGAFTTFRALDLGALDFVPKPGPDSDLGVEQIESLLKNRVQEIIQSRQDTGPARPVPAVSGSPDGTAPRVNLSTPAVPGQYDVLLIGASTGGPQALQEIFRNLPQNFPAPVILVQHMPPFFTAAFADRLNNLGSLSVVEAISGMPLKPGHAYVAPGNRHLLVTTNGDEVLTELNDDPPLRAHKPAIDRTLLSVVDAYGGRAAALIMTGMGRDGVEGAQALCRAGGFVLAQDEASSVVYGMNRRAVEAGVVHEVVPLKNIVEVLSRYFP